MAKHNAHTGIKVLAISRNFPNAIRPYEGTWAYTQFKALQECGADVRVLSPRVYSLATLKDIEEFHYNRSRPVQWEYKDLHVYGPKCVYWLSGSLFRQTYAFQTYLGLKRKIENIYDQWPFNAIYTQGILPDAAMAIRFAKKKNIVTSGCVIGQAEVTNNIVNQKIKKLTIHTLKSLDVVFAESASVAASAEELIDKCRRIHPLLRGSFPEDIAIVPNVQHEWKQKFRCSPESVICMYVGHLYTAKGVYDLLDAYKEVQYLYPFVKLVYVGKGDQEAGLKEKASEYGLSDKVYFTGAVPYEHVPSLMSVSDFICSPSHHEGLGLVNVEAGFVGKPVIGANTGGIPEVICDGLTGLLFRPKDTHDLAKKMMRLIKSKSLRDEMGDQAASFVYQYHNAHKNTNKLYELLTQAYLNKSKL